MSEWQRVTLDHALEINPFVEMTKGEQYPFVDMQTVQAGNKFVEALQHRGAKSGGSRFVNGDTLMAKITPCLENGKISRYKSRNDLPAHGSTEFIILRYRKDVTHPEFVYYLAISNQVKSRAVKQMTGTSGRQRVSVGAFKSLEVNLPSMREQKAIADVLSSLDDKIEHNRCMIETLEAMGKALFQSWFVDFEPVRAKAAGHPTELPDTISDLFPDELVSSKLGDIPKGWEVKPMDEIADFLNGLALQKYPAKEGSPSLPVIKIAEINRGISQQTARASFDIPEAYIIDDGDVIFSWSGSLTATLWSHGRGALNQHLFKVTSEKYPKWFYYYWVWEHMPFYRRTAASKATTMGHIKRQHLSETKALVPSSDLLQEADKVLMPILSRVIMSQIESRQLASVRDTLLPKLMAGEVRVEDIP